MQSLAELKRYLIKDATLTMIWADWAPKSNRPLPWPRKVVEVQTNGVWMIDPSDSASKKSFLEFPKASMIDFHNETFTTYYLNQDGKRMPSLSYAIR